MGVNVKTDDLVASAKALDGAVWPNFLIVGAPKSGTTSLYHYLNQHPDVFLSPVRKEGRFFSGVGRGDVYWPDFYHFDTAPEPADYQRLFTAYDGETRIGDVSPDYLSYAHLTAPRVEQICGRGTRIIAILRQPVVRSYSHYLQNVRRDAEFLSFAKSLEVESWREKQGWGFQWLYTKTSQYRPKLEAWMQACDEVLVLLQDDLHADSAGVARQIFDFLELDPIETETRKRYNTGGIPADKMDILGGTHDHRADTPFEQIHAEFVAPVSGVSGASSADGVYPPIQPADVSVPPMPPEIRAELDARFAPEIDQLEDLLGRSLDVWRS